MCYSPLRQSLIDACYHVTFSHLSTICLAAKEKNRPVFGLRLWFFCFKHSRKHGFCIPWVTQIVCLAWRRFMYCRHCHIYYVSSCLMWRRWLFKRRYESSLKIILNRYDVYLYGPAFWFIFEYFVYEPFMNEGFFNTLSQSTCFFKLSRRRGTFYSWIVVSKYLKYNPLL